MLWVVVEFRKKGEAVYKQSELKSKKGEEVPYAHCVPGLPVVVEWEGKEEEAEIIRKVNQKAAPELSNPRPSTAELQAQEKKKVTQNVARLKKRTSADLNSQTREVALAVKNTGKLKTPRVQVQVQKKDEEDEEPEEGAEFDEEEKNQKEKLIPKKLMPEETKNRIISLYKSTSLTSPSLSPPTSFSSSSPSSSSTNQPQKKKLKMEQGELSLENLWSIVNKQQIEIRKLRADIHLNSVTVEYVGNIAYRPINSAFPKIKVKCQTYTKASVASGTGDAISLLITELFEENQRTADFLKSCQDDRLPAIVEFLAFHQLKMPKDQTTYYSAVHRFIQKTYK